MELLATALAQRGEPPPHALYGDVIGRIPIDYNITPDDIYFAHKLPAPAVPHTPPEHWLPSELRTPPQEDVVVGTNAYFEAPTPLPRIFATNRAVLAWLRNRASLNGMRDLVPGQGCITPAASGGKRNIAVT
jgi:hypothetical protein